jgi:hypothetical protein
LIGENNRELELIDSVTGERLLGNLAEHEARLEAEARAEQAENKLYQTVFNMLSEGLTKELISRLTGLSITEIENLSK